MTPEEKAANRALHIEADGACEWCGERWPCFTVRALAEVDRLNLDLTQAFKDRADSRAAERARIFAAVEALPVGTYEREGWVYRAAVLAAIDGGEK